MKNQQMEKFKNWFSKKWLEEIRPVVEYIKAEKDDLTEEQALELLFDFFFCQFEKYLNQGHRVEEIVAFIATVATQDTPKSRSNWLRVRDIAKKHDSELDLPDIHQSRKTRADLWLKTSWTS